MTLYERIWADAAETFGKRRGFPESLTPFGRTWLTVIERSEHAIWLWNSKYGPLSPEQREYAGALISSALKYARENAPNVGQTYAFFHTQLTHLLNHETVHQGFQKRADREPEGALLDSLDIFAEAV